MYVRTNLVGKGFWHQFHSAQCQQTYQNHALTDERLHYDNVYVCVCTYMCSCEHACVYVYIYMYMCVYDKWLHDHIGLGLGYLVFRPCHEHTCSLQLYCIVLCKCQFLHKCPTPILMVQCFCTLFEITKSHCIVSSKFSGQIIKHLCWYGCIAHICNINCSNAQQHSALSHTPLPTFIFFFHSHKQ